MSATRKRLVTKCDMDGLACGILLKEMDMIDRIVFTHPKDIENGNIRLDENDITAGLPYRDVVHLAFDYYPGSSRLHNIKANLVLDSSMPSTSRVICNYYQQTNNPKVSKELLEAVDKGYSANISIDEILYPTGWILLSYLLDQRTGLEHYATLAITNTQMIEKLIDESKGKTIWEILNSNAVEERLNLYFKSIERCKAQLLRHSEVHYNLVVTDMRKVDVRYPGNRFLIYALFPECNVSMQVVRDLSGGKTNFVVGKSVLDRSYKRDIGKILKGHGGGGHCNAGTCSIDESQADELKEQLISELRYGTLENIFNGYFN